MSDYLPQEVLVDILVRLPVKCLLRFRCVSKSWNFLITSPLFITAHIHHQTQTNPLLFLSCQMHADCSTLRCDNASFMEYSKVNSIDGMVFLFPDGSCNGVVCLRNSSSNVLILWNPSIKRCFKLPAPIFDYTKCLSCFLVCWVSVGFGFDSHSNDYKVVRIVNMCDKTTGTCRRKTKTVIEVYSLIAGSWKTIAVNLGLLPLHFWSSPAFVNGALHWLAYRMVNGKEQNCIMSFDLRNELFQENVLPECLVHVPIREVLILAFEKSLALFWRTISFECHVWVMKEYGVGESWAKQSSFKLNGFASEPLVFRKNGEILMGGEILMDNYNRLDSRDLHNQAVKDLKIGLKHHCFNYSCSYVESLVLLDKPNNINLDEKPTRKRKQR